jgi:predicted ATPase
MTVVAISGTHGAGKSTLVEALAVANAEFTVYHEFTRELIALLPYASPYDIVAQNGIAMYEALVLGQWSRLDSDAAPIVISDRSPIDNLAYYFLHRSDTEAVHEAFLVALCAAFLPRIKLHIHVPPLPFAVPLDAMQRADTQGQLADIILGLYARFGVHFITLHSHDLQDRVRESLGLINEVVT